MNTKHALATLALIGVAATSTGCSAKIAKGEGYSIPIPAGWRQSQGEFPLPPKALAIRQKSKSHADYMTASVVVTIVPPSNPPFDPTSESLCKQVGEAIAKQTGATLRHAGVVDGPTGKTCQTDVLGDNGKQAALGTYVKLPQSTWMVTCNRDPRDEEAAKACSEALKGMKAE